MSPRPPRILVVDDDAAVLDVYRRVLGPPIVPRLAAARSALFGSTPVVDTFAPEVTLVTQGAAAIEATALATAQGGFAMAFVDMRMPPGLDGLATVERLWTLDSDLQVVIASAYGDVPWEQMSLRFGATDRLIFLKKPFDPIEVRQLAIALCRKRELLHAARLRERQLELHVAARTEELAKALRVANEAAAARMQFLAHMSHEIRTPLTAILGFAEQMRDPNLGAAERQEQLAIVERNSQHLLRLVNDVLDLSKLEARQLLLEQGPVDVPALVEEILASMRPLADEKGLALRAELAGVMPRSLTTDGHRVRQILLNLVGNAIKFTERGSVTVRLGEAGGSDNVTFAVVDTGIGIPEPRLAALFEPFVQVDASTSRRFGGSGLGLSISRRLAELLGGTVVVASEAGCGSTFALVLPAAVRTPGAADLAAADLGVRRPDVVARGPAVRLRGRVLLAEDGLDNQRLLGGILRRAGAEVTIVGDGQAAVDEVLRATAAATPYSLVLMDMQMPVLDGYSATRRLREQGWRGPIVALTAHAMEGDRDRCIAEGCDGYETKPIRAARLVEVAVRFGLVP